MNTEAELAAAMRRMLAFSPRRRAVWLGVLEGKMNKTIARELGISLASVDFHLWRGAEVVGYTARDVQRALARVALANRRYWVTEDDKP